MTTAPPRCSLVVPVYGNADTITDLVEAIAVLAVDAPGGLEAVFVIDGSPDDSEARLRSLLPSQSFPSAVLVHARNFGSFAAIRTGMAHARGDLIAVMAADLQEPPALIGEFLRVLDTGDADVVVGCRTGRADPASSRRAAETFWRIYRRFVQAEMPEGGIDVFACNRVARDTLLSMQESNSSLVGLLIWMGFTRVEVPYERLPRPSGESGWTFKKKVRYMSDSIFSFTDLPIRVLLLVGTLGSAITLLLSVVIAVAWAAGLVSVQGYTPLMLAVLFVGTLILAGLGVVGSYVWRTFENTKGRPLSIVRAVHTFNGPRS